MDRSACTIRAALLAVVFLSAVGSAVAGEAWRAPAVWVFMGLAGDDDRRTRYLQTVERTTAALTSVYGVPRGDIRVLFDRGKPAPYPACTGSAVLKELDRAKDALRSGRPVWLLLLGHGATVTGDSVFHVQYRDLGAREIAERLSGAASWAELAVLLTTSASGGFLAPLRGPGRILVAAAPPGAVDSETEFPHAMADVLADPRTADANGDGVLSLAELVGAARQRVAAWYAERGLVCTESAVVDGDGDGRADAGPDGEDVRWAERVGLRFSPPAAKE